MATGVSVTDSVPAGYTGIAGISGGGSLTGNTITWNGLSVGVGGTSQVSFNAVVEELENRIDSVLRVIRRQQGGNE